MASPWLPGLLCAALCAALCFGFRPKKASSKHFPSPPSDPLIGHVRYFPLVAPWMKLAEWADRYGNIFQLSILGKPVIIMDKAEDAHQLLDKRGNNYSDRTKAVMHGELIGLEHLLFLLPYGDDFRTVRRFIARYFNSRDYVQLYSLLANEIADLLKNLLNNPVHFGVHLQKVSAGTIAKSTYGPGIMANDDGYIKLAAAATSAATLVGMIGLTPVDFFPFLRHVPSWFPGAILLKRAESARKLVKRMIDEPYEWVKAQRKIGISQPSFVDALMDEYEEGTIDKGSEVLMKNAAGVIFAAGTETSVDLLLTFLLMMLQHPKVVQKAQAELDRVTENKRLPALEDRPNLPYIECILKETLRINPPLPLGIPHVSMKEDVYKDKIIPGGSLLLANIWAMMRDKRYYHDPNVFNPDRFLVIDAKPESSVVHPLNSFRPDDPASLAFGFGRRICPGRFFAESSAWLTMASVLFAFDILPPINPTTGEEYVPKFKWISGVTAKPEPFHARLISRSESHTQLIKQL